MDGAFGFMVIVCFAGVCASVGVGAGQFVLKRDIEQQCADYGRTLVNGKFYSCALEPKK